MVCPACVWSEAAVWSLAAAVWSLAAVVWSLSARVWSLACLYVVSIGTLHEFRHLGIVLHGGLVVGFARVWSAAYCVSRACSLAMRCCSAALRLISAAARASSALARRVSASTRACSACTRADSALTRPCSAVMRCCSAVALALSAFTRACSALMRACSASLRWVSADTCRLVLLAQFLCCHAQGFILCDGLIEGCNAVALGLDAAHVDDTEPPCAVADRMSHVAALQRAIDAQASSGVLHHVGQSVGGAGRIDTLPCLTHLELQFLEFRLPYLFVFIGFTI